MITQRPVFDLVRERLGARLSLLNVVASFFLNTLALVAELCGVALGIELATDMHYLLWVPLVALVAFLVMWRLPFEHMERLYGLVGCSCSCSSSLLAAGGSRPPLAAVPVPHPRHLLGSGPGGPPP